MAESTDKSRIQAERQVAHWAAAVRGLEGWEKWASADAWRGLEQYLGLTLRRNLALALERLRQHAAQLEAQARMPTSAQPTERIRRGLLGLRAEYIRAETMLDFFGDAINTRSGPEISALLRGCDILAAQSMRQILDQLGKKTPPVLTYVDKGLGASVLKAGLRLWDGVTINPVSAIKIVRHNLRRPSSLFHEAGHQVAHQLDWNDEMAGALAASLRDAPLSIVETWTGWSSEIVGDVFALVHTGYASVAALHDVLAGEEETVFALRPGDPHPVSFIRVLLGVEMCRQCYGAGPWDDLAASWTDTHPLERAPGEARELLAQSIPLLPTVARVSLRKPMRAFNGKAIVQCIDPQRVSPAQLAELEKAGGQALSTSTHWAATEALRITALTGYRSATAPAESAKYWRMQEDLMMLLGGMTRQPATRTADEREALHV
ncbi:MAG: hypothetical protein WAW06_11505 [bacterium]